MPIFNSIFIKLEEFFRSLDPKIWGAIISVAILSSLLLFWMSIRKSRKNAGLIANYFLFYVAAAILIFALVGTIVSSSFR